MRQQSLYQRNLQRWCQRLQLHMRPWFHRQELLNWCVPDRIQRRIQDFHLGGGGAQMITCADAHYEREIRSPFRQGSREALGDFNAL